MKIHQAISASAGSGKTFQLTTRYIGLLAQGAAPERIVALTFTRKAAGEMFDRILQRLAVACVDGEKRSELNGMLSGLPPLDSSDCLALLRSVLSSMARLRIGTLDSFYAQVVRAFPLELGLSGEFEIMDEPAQVSARFDVLRRLLCYGLDRGKLELLEAFRQSTFGKEEKRVAESLLGFIDAFQRIYLCAPKREYWGEPTVIWPDGGLWFGGRADVTEEEIEDFLQRHPEDDWQKALTYFSSWDLGSSSKPNALANRLLESAEAMARGAVAVKVRRKLVELDFAESQFLMRLIRSMMQKTLAVKLEETKGLYQLLHAYEDDYHRSVRLAGRLTFSDMLYLLARGPLLSREKEARQDRLYIDYRLDGEFDHWLLDEFQDTSTQQWSILKNLMDEVVKHQQPDRTLFYVGDVKQAIYAWRGGDSALFHRVLADYKEVELSSLSTSWRSSPAVIDTVNLVFNTDTMNTLAIDDAVKERWAACWQTHEVAALNRSLSGYAALYEVERGPGREKKPYCFQLTVSLVKDLLEKRASVGILVRGNKSASEMAGWLRKAGIEANIEGERLICEQPEVAAFLSLVKLAEHPGDLYAKRHVQMADFASCDGGVHPSVILRAIHQHGFEVLAQTYLKNPSADLIQLCRLFDASRNRKTADFIDYIQQAKVPVPPVPGSVTIMTLHKSKGLEFDAVILPDLENRGMETADMGLEVHEEDGVLQWVLNYPAKEVVGADPALCAHRQAKKQESAYEALCLLYVGVTRARRGLYMITTKPGKSSKTVYPATLLQHALSGEPLPMQHEDFEYERTFSMGDCDWVMPEKGNEQERKEMDDGPMDIVERIRYQRRLPSGDDADEFDAAELFSLQRLKAMEYGSVIHGIFEQIGWANSVEDAMSQVSWDGVEQGMQGHVERLLNNPTILSNFKKPTENVELWREQPFEGIVDGEWITGRFDRVVLCYGNSGEIEKATLVDWKSQRESEELSEGKYAKQLALYRVVLSRLTGLSADKIDARLVFLASA